MTNPLPVTRLKLIATRWRLLSLVYLLLLTTVSQAVPTRAQDVLNREVNIQCQSQRLLSVLNQIETNAQVTFVFSSRLIQPERLVSLNARHEKLSVVLTALLAPLNVGYEVSGNKIILNRRAVPSTLPATAQPDSRPNVGLVETPVSGKVSTKTGEGMPGVNVAIKGTTRGTVTDAEGSFKINANTGEVLIFSFIGYQSREVSVVDGQAVINVTLTESSASLSEVVVVGSRFAKPRTDVDRPVPIDVISTKELQSTGQADLGQAITFSAPSFNATKFGINDAAPFVDPATLRGLGPDQVLVLVNNKRRHKVSFVSINDGVGKGQVGTDINVVPALSLKRVEVLRDGAAAQYGSDAIAGVVNLQLNDASSGGAVTLFTGMGYSTPNLDVKGVIPPATLTDGKTVNFAANAGIKLFKKGFLNTTISYANTEGYDRSGPYKAAAGFYVKDAVQDAALVAKNNINLDRAFLGAAKNITMGLFVNAGLPLNQNWDLYAFGGYTNKFVETGVFTRPPSNTRRSVLEIFPNGYNPIAPATLHDYAITAGLKGKLGKDWNMDLSLSQGGNSVDWRAKNTVNPSLGAASPTEFYVGQTSVSQTLFNGDVAKSFRAGSYPNFNLGGGVEFRYESFKQVAGDEAAWKAGPLKATKDVGSSGREGFSPATAGEWGRTNLGVYVEAESDLTRHLLVGGAVRFENYSDFGSNVAYKLNTRVKVADPFSIRASVSRGFRAPSVVQSHYSNYVNISFDNAGNSIINPIIPATGALAEVLGSDGLKQESSFDLAGGITSKIGDHFTLTADVYQIDVDNRIMLSSQIDVSKLPQFVAAGFPQTATLFVNAIDTRTQGFELVANYNNRIGAGRLVLNAAFSSMTTSLRANRKTSKGIDVADPTATLYITDGLPKDKLIASVNYEIGKFGVLIRGSRFGTVADPLATLAVVPTDPTAVKYQIFSAKTLFDANITFRPVKAVSVMLGVNNIFDVYPDLLQATQTTNEVVFSRRTNQFGTQGRFLNLTLNYNF
jgi:iron complex outermembrane recepter protein